MNDARLIKFGSVCSGIEAASVAWEPLGFSAAWLAEIDKFPSAVLAHHYPKIKNLGDMSNIVGMIKSQEIEAPEVLVGGTPCQAFSVAGLRAGLSDSRGQLTLKFVELADAIDARRTSDGLGESVVIWENVPGVLSSSDNAFGCFLAGLAGESEPLEPPGKKWANAGCVFGPKRAIAWRVLDAQYFGLAQRRKRVFVIASARKEFDPTKILFEFDGVRRDSPPSREPGQDVAGTLASRTSGGGFPGTDEAVSGYLQVSRTITTREGLRLDPTLETYVVHGTQDPCTSSSTAFALGRNNGGENVVVAIQDCSGREKAQNGCGWSADGTAYTVDTHATQGVAYAFSCKDNGADAIADLAPTMRAMGHGESHANAGGQLAVAFAENSRAEVRLEGGDGQRTGALACGGGKPGQGVPMIAIATAVRRLTPRECERLQGFPDDYTLTPWRGKAPTECPDGPRYKALGNSMAVNVMQWIGRRVQEYLRGGQSDFETGKSCQRWLTRKAAQNGAPGRSRTCDPRLRRP